MFYKKNLLLLTAALLVFLAACSKNDPDTEKKDKGEGSKQPKQTETEKVLPYEFPLTGVKTDQKPASRSVAVMVNNHPAARPQSGLSQADIVYEVLAEGNVTRLLAIFQSEKPESIGPVRSARDYFIELAQGYDSLYIAHGYSPDAKDMLLSGKYDHLNGMQYDGTLFKRASFRKAPHNSYISYDRIEKGASDNNYSMDTAPAGLDFLTKEEAETPEGTKTGSVKISYGSDPLFTAEYIFDEGKGKYSRLVGGEETAEYDSGKPVLIDNIIVIEASHRVIDEYGRRAIDLTSGGKAFVWQKGMMQETEWKNVNGRLLPYSGGVPVKLVPGKTWISIVPSMTSVKYGE